VPYAKIPVSPGYQVPFAAKIRESCQIKTAAVGLITEPNQLNDIILSGSADLVFVAREFMREPYFGLQTEKALEHEQSWPSPTATPSAKASQFYCRKAAQSFGR